MAESRLFTLHEIAAPRLVKQPLAILPAVAIYDSLSSQFGLPKLGRLAGMSGSLLPWWGWLLIIQAVFVYGLFEYVRRRIPYSAATPVSPLTAEDLEVAISRRLGEMQRGTVAATFEASDGRWSSMVKHFEERCDALAESVQALAGNTAAVDNTLLERLGTLQVSYKAIIDDYQRMSALEVRFKESQSRLQTALAPIIALPPMVESLRSDLVVVQRDLEKMEEVQRGERDRRLGSLYALGARERLADLQSQIEQDASALYDDLRSGKVYDQCEWDQWEAIHSRWQTRLGEWLDTATWYALAVKERTLTVDESKYALNWSVLENQFPNAEAVRRFRKFRIIHQQWEQVIPNVIGGLNGVAFNGLTDLEARSGRPAG